MESALGSNSDIGSQKGLLKYQSKHMKITKPLYYGTNGLVKLYTNENLPAKVARSASPRLANNMSPIKRFISRRLAEDEKGRGIFFTVLVESCPSRLLKFAELCQTQGKIKRKRGIYKCK